ncbi:tRNA methyltransferase roswell [Augochlora pura]
MINNVLRGCSVISRKFHLSTSISIVQDKIVNTVFTPSKQKHRFNYCALITRKCTQLSRSHMLKLEYDEFDEKKLKTLMEDPKHLLAYQKLQVEVEAYRYLSGRIPTTLTATDWLMLLAATSKGQRRSYLEYRWKVELAKAAAKAKKESNKNDDQVVEPVEHIEYGLARNTMFIRICDKTMNNFYNKRLIDAIMYGPKVVFDVGYDKDMTAYESQNCAKQLLLSFSLNRYHKNPFNLYFCNANKSGLVMRQLHKCIPPIYDDYFPINITEKSYLDVFDKDKLIYLTPDAKQTIEDFDHDKVYIIGAMVDKVNPQRVSFAKARKERIKMARLPLAEKLEWGTGSTKNLPLNQVLGILLDLHHTNNWDAALKHIPNRKLKPARLNNIVSNMRRNQRLIEQLTNVK